MIFFNQSFEAIFYNIYSISAVFGSIHRYISLRQIKF